MIMEIVGIFLSTLIVIWLSQGDWWREIIYFLDPPTLICMLILTTPVLLKKGLGKDFVRAVRLLNRKYTCSFSELRHALDVVEMVQKQILYAGVIVSFQGTFAMLRNLNDLSSLGPNLSVALLAIFYTAVFELLMLPLQIEAKRRIVDYMEQDNEETEKGQDAEKA